MNMINYPYDPQPTNNRSTHNNKPGKTVCQLLLLVVFIHTEALADLFTYHSKQIS